jgi:PIN domain
MPEISRPYDRVYFDSNVFLRLQWPRVNQTLLNAMSILKDFRIPAILLDSVEKELRAHFLRVLAAAKTETGNKARAVASICKSIGVRAPSISLPSIPKIETAYNKTSAKAIRQLGLLKRAPPLREAKQLFEMAIQRAKPFQERGKNFQDAVICLTAIDDLVSSSDKTAAFVSGDGIFEQSVLDELCEAHGVRLIFFGSLQALTDDLRKHLDEQQAKEWSDDEKFAEQAVRGELPTIQKFLEANLEIPTRMGLFRRRQILKINRIEIAKIARIETPSPAHRTPGLPITITAQLEINIHATVRMPRASSSLTETLKMGESRPKLADRIAGMYIDDDEILSRQVTVELEAVREGDKYGHVGLRSASLGASESKRRAPSPFGRIGSMLGSV